MNKSWFIPALSLVVVTASPVHADSIRCGRQLISTGDTAFELTQACGEPRSKDRGKALLTVDGTLKNVSVERWYYRKSSRSRLKTVVLYRGRVTAVEIGEP